jgi:hypothetical protein
MRKRPHKRMQRVQHNAFLSAAAQDSIAAPKNVAAPKLCHCYHIAMVEEFVDIDIVNDVYPCQATIT